jgi:hypothetical protein
MGFRMGICMVLQSISIYIELFFEQVLAGDALHHALRA